MKSKTVMKYLYFSEHQYFLFKNPFFCNPTGKVFKIYSCYLSCFRFDAALFNLHILSCKIFLFFALKSDIFIFRYILGNACYAITYTLNKISNWSLFKLIISDQALIKLK